MGTNRVNGAKTPQHHIENIKNKEKESIEAKTETLVKEGLRNKVKVEKPKGLFGRVTSTLTSPLMFLFRAISSVFKVLFMSSSHITPLEQQQRTIKEQYDQLKTHNKPPPSIQKLLDKSPTLESLNKLRKWLEVRGTIIVYKKIEDEVIPHIMFDTAILQSDEWEKLPELYNKWSKFNSGHLKKVTKLDLSDNQLTTLDKKIFQQLVNLEVLDLSDNQLTNLDQEIFQELGNLEVLDLSDNQLTNLDQEIFQELGNLQSLDITGNQLSNDLKALTPLNKVTMNCEIKQD